MDEVNKEELICQAHNEPAIFVDISYEAKFICLKCFMESRSPLTGISLKEVASQIETILTLKNQSVEETLNKIYDFKSKLQTIQNQLLLHFTKMININQEWISDLENERKEFNGNTTIRQNLKLIKLDIAQIENILSQKNENYLKKIMNEFDKLQKNNYQNFFKEAFRKFNFQNLDQEKQIGNIYQQPPEPKQLSIPQKQAVISQKVEKFEIVQSSVIAFNRNSLLLCAGRQKELKIFRFDKGQLIQLQKVQMQEGNLQCLVFSQRENYFLTGSSNSQICFWKQVNQHDFQWVCSQPGIEHKSSVMCLVLNNKEDELISCSSDKRIILWKLLNENLYHKYTFEERHKAAVVSINLDKAQTTLVSGGLDKAIILWKYQNMQRKWIYLHQVEIEDFPKTIRFISKFEILWQQNSKGTCHVLRYQNGKLIIANEMSFDFDNLENYQPLFPTFISQDKEKILMIYNQFVYILQKNIDGRLKLISKTIDCGTCDICAALTQDGEYIALQTNQNGEIKIHKMKYE